MNLIEWTNRCMDESMRVDKIIWIGGTIADSDTVSPDLEEYLEQTPNLEFAATFPGLPHHATTELTVEDRVEVLVDNNKFGFLIKVVTPCMRYRGDESWTYSWGRTCSHWFYGETLEDALEMGLDWVDEQREAEKERA